MKVSQRTEYGLRAMVAIASMAGERRPVPLSAVAEAEGIPEQFLDQIVMQLRKAGFVKSVRGVNGGYLLSRPAEEISVGSVVRVLEGSLAPMGCIGDGELTVAEEFCDRASHCHTRSVWLRVMAAVTRALDSISLADVMRDEVPLMQAL
ncbi:MAG: Rrf2 family transcriptional regulator [Alicyclobacillaceae bacterium]|nr:Rrf2 family transcriptional regulator [Alicyclobacillaceae bacterium]